MATIAVHRESGTRYILLGGGIRMFTATHPVRVDARSKPGLDSPKSLPVTMMMVCDADGTVVWFRSEEMLVTEVDGGSPAAILTSGTVYR